MILVFSVWSNSGMFGRPWKPSAPRCQGNTNVPSWVEAVTAPQQGQTSRGAFKLRVIGSSNQKKEKKKKPHAPPESYHSICSRSRQSERGGFPHLLIKHQIGLSTPLPTPRWRERRLGRFKRGSDRSKDTESRWWFELPFYAFIPFIYLVGKAILENKGLLCFIRDPGSARRLWSSSLINSDIYGERKSGFAWDDNKTRVLFLNVS